MFFMRRKKLNQLLERMDKLESRSYEINGLDRRVREMDNKLKRQDTVIEKIANEIKSSPIKNDEINFIGDEEEAGGYLQEVEVYDLLKSYNGGFWGPYSITKCNITISIKIDGDRAKRKEVFESVKRAYPKLLEYFRQ